MNHMPVSVASVKLPAVRAWTAGSKAGSGPARMDAAAMRSVVMAKSQRIVKGISRRTDKSRQKLFEGSAR